MSNKPNDVLRVATINTLNNTELYEERFLGIVLEATQTQVDVLLLQEVLVSRLDEVKTILQEQGYGYYTFTEGGTGSSFYVTCGIASRYPISKSDSVFLHTANPSIPMATATIKYNNHDVTLLSTYMFWGGENENIRLISVRAINQYAVNIKKEKPNSIVIVGGDFNTEPDSDSIRYLQGKQAVEGIQSAFWVDTSMRTEWEHYPTGRSYGEWGIKTALIANILNPLLVPERKLDYLMVHGWAYGRYGSPSSYSLFGVTLTACGHELSDHYGVISDFWLPEH